MRLKQLLQLIEDITKRKDLSSAFIVGGVPRDKLLGRLERISDLDLTTGDDDVKYLAKELAIILGQQYKINAKEMKDGHISIFAGDLKIDFSSNFNVPGIEGILKQGGIANPTSMQKELFSRDFTCNTLLMNLDLKKIADPTGRGLKDIKEKMIRTCLAPEITLTSNKNRVVRAIYLAAKLGFELDGAIVEWVKTNPHSIKIASAHTLVEKLNDAFDYDAEKSARLISQMGLWGEIPINEKLYPYWKASQSNQKTAQLKEDKHSLTFFRNYDYGTGKNEKMGPGKGLYMNLDKYKSVSEFLAKKRKKKKRTNRAKMAVIFGITCPDAVVGRAYKKDTNDLQDPYEGPPNENAANKPSESSSFPYNPAEVAPMGIYDGILPKEDLEFQPLHNLYFGIQEEHDFNVVDDNKIDDSELTKEVDQYGTIRYYDENHKLHRDNDMPAEIYSSGAKHWWQHGLEHRDNDKPTSEFADGHKEWKINGELHREGDKPAVIWNSGRKEYYIGGQRHREEGPAIIQPNGEVSYYYHGVKQPAMRTEVVRLWDGLRSVWVDWTDLVFRPVWEDSKFMTHTPDTQENTIWVYSDNYEPLYRPKLQELKGNNPKPAATLHDIDEGLPPPETGLKNADPRDQ